MALMETHYYSSSLGSNITLNVFVPTPGSSEQITQMGHCEKYDYEHGLPVLYLLHGAYGLMPFPGCVQQYRPLCAGPWDRCCDGIRRKFILSGSGEWQKVQDLFY